MISRTMYFFEYENTSTNQLNNIYFTHFCTIQVSILQKLDRNFEVIATVILGEDDDDRHSNTI